MNYRLKSALLSALLLGSSPVMAMSFGQIQADSTLGHPLKATISFSLDKTADIKQIHAGLASSSAFSKAGISRSGIAQSLQFKVLTLKNGHGVIQVVSRKPVNAPVIDFLIQLRTPHEQASHAYTLLLDPAEETEQTAATSASKVSGKQSSAQRRDSSYKVRKGDIVTAIASRYALKGVTNAQMALALQKLNPDAFYRPNINALKMGATLRIPSKKQATAVSPTQAFAQLQQQKQAWEESKQVVKKEKSGAVETTPEAPAKKSGSSENPSSRSSSEKDSSNSVSDTKPDVATEQTSPETPDSTNHPDADKPDTVDTGALDADTSQTASSAVNQGKEHVLGGEQSSKNPRSGASDAALTQTQAPDAENVDDVVAGKPTLGTYSDSTPASGESNHLSPLKKVSVPTAAEKVEKSSADTVARSESVTSEASRQKVGNKSTTKSWYDQEWVRIALSAILVLLAGLILLRRLLIRRRSKQHMPLFFDPFSQHDKDAEEIFDEESTPTENSPLEMLQTEADGSEKSLGESTLIARLKAEPENLDAYLELASMHYLSRDDEKFIQIAQFMHEHITDEGQDEWQEMREMGLELVPSHPLFDAAFPASRQEQTDDGREPSFSVLSGEKNASGLTEEDDSVMGEDLNTFLDDYDYTVDFDTQTDDTARDGGVSPHAEARLSDDEASLEGAMLVDSSPAESTLDESILDYSGSEESIEDDELLLSVIDENNDTDSLLENEGDPLDMTSLDMSWNGSDNFDPLNPDADEKNMEPEKDMDQENMQHDQQSETAEWGLALALEPDTTPDVEQNSMDSVDLSDGDHQPLNEEALAEASNTGATEDIETDADVLSSVAGIEDVATSSGGETETLVEDEEVLSFNPSNEAPTLNDTAATHGDISLENVEPEKEEGIAEDLTDDIVSENTDSDVAPKEKDALSDLTDDRETMDFPLAADDATVEEHGHFDENNVLANDESDKAKLALSPEEDKSPEGHVDTEPAQHREDTARQVFTTQSLSINKVAQQEEATSTTPVSKVSYTLDEAYLSPEYLEQEVERAYRKADRMNETGEKDADN